MSHSPTSPDGAAPRGILRNAPQYANSNEELSQLRASNVAEKLDRKKVLENTRLNAQLQNLGTEDDITEGEKIRRKISEKKRRQGSATSEEHLQWDEVNLYLTEQDKSSTMKIDEPKTPYEGGVDPNNEYYRSDDEEDELDGAKVNDADKDNGLDDFALGEPLEEVPTEGVKESLHGGEIVHDDEEEDEDEEEEEKPRLSAAERHQLFEERRKNHYHMKAEALKHPLPVDDDEE